MKMLFCVVEGKGEEGAIPSLCARILKQHLNTSDWNVPKQAFRQPRDRLVHHPARGQNPICNTEGLRNIVQTARQKRANGLLVICDSDDDRPADWEPAATRLISGLMVGGAVMAVREYETWLLQNYSDEELIRIGEPTPERRRDAKGALRKLVKEYKPSTHQLPETRKIDIARLRRRSDSFDNLVRVLAKIAGATPPAR